MASGTAEKITKSMYELMASVGYEKASINAICKNVGVTKSSFYHFFQSKEQVLRGIVEDSYAMAFTDEIARIRQVEDIEEYKQSLLQVGFELVEVYQNNDKWRKVCAEINLLSERIPAIRQIVHETNQGFLDFLMEYFLHGVAIGAFPAGFDVEENVGLLFTVFLGLDEIILYDVPVDARKVVKSSIERMFLATV